LVSRKTESHVVLHKSVEDSKIVTVVLMHKKVKVGTVFGILALEEIKKEDFLKKL